MGVAYSGTHSPGKGTGTSISTGNITISGTNPALMIGAGIASQTLTSIGWGGTGTPATLVNTASGTCRGVLGVVPAPAGTSKTVTITPGASAAIQVDAALFTGAHQTTPCPAADVVSETVASTPRTLTPTNLATGDASFGAQPHTVAEDCSSVTPNQIYLDSSTAVNLQTGYAADTTGVTFALTGGTASVVSMAARIQQPAAAGFYGSPQMAILAGHGNV